MNCNKAIVIGRITKELELKATNSGTSVLSFSVATSQRWKDNNGNQQEKAEFHNVVAWGKQAEVVAQYFVKGQEIYVEGRLETRSWDDQQSGKKMYRTEIVLEKFEFGAKPANAQPQHEQQQEEEPFNEETDDHGNPENVNLTGEDDVKISEVPF